MSIIISKIPLWITFKTEELKYTSRTANISLATISAWGVLAVWLEGRHFSIESSDSSGIYICKSVENDVRHGNYICKSEVIYLTYEHRI